MTIVHAEWLSNKSWRSNESAEAAAKYEALRAAQSGAAGEVAEALQEERDARTRMESEIAQQSTALEGISYGCRRCECALLGGETAEMPGFYKEGQYDLAGFCVGVV